MLLSKDRILQLGIVRSARNENFRDSSYDLRVRAILPAPKEEKHSYGFLHSDVSVPASGFYLEPQGMVRVVSEETLTLPKNITGYALVKNRFSNLGILAINIGIIDPGYEGPISSTLINFGKQPYLLKPGTVFLRLTFHEFDPPQFAPEPQRSTYNEYLARTKEEVGLYSGSTFLGLDKTAEYAGVLAFGRFKRWLIAWAAVVALMLGFLTALVPVGASYADKVLARRDALEKRVKTDERKILDLEYQLENVRIGVSADKASKHGAPNR